MTQLNELSLSEFVAEQLQGTDCFPVRIDFRPGKVIVVEIDSDSRVDIDLVAELNRRIEEHFTPEIDDYDLEVGSVGLTSPLSMPRQFRKNIGNDVVVLAKDGKKYHGILRDADDSGFIIAFEEKMKKEGQKKPVVEMVEKRFDYADAKSVVYDIKF